MTIVIRLHGNAAGASRKKLEQLVRRMAVPPITEPIEFAVPGADDGEAKRTERGGVDGG